MRTLRLSLVGMASFSLLSALATTVWAQEPATSPTLVLGTVTQSWGFSAGTGYSGHQETIEDGVIVGRGAVEHQEVAWSDPRLPSPHWIRMDYDIRQVDEPDGVMTVTSSHLLIGEEGSWRGNGRAVETADGRWSTYEFTGEGAYEGLYALLQGTPGVDAHGPWDQSYVGFIFEGTLPAFPELPEPLDIEGIQHVPIPRPPPAGG